MDKEKYLQLLDEFYNMIHNLKKELIPVFNDMSLCEVLNNNNITTISFFDIDEIQRIIGEIQHLIDMENYEELTIRCLYKDRIGFKLKCTVWKDNVTDWIIC